MKITNNKKDIKKESIRKFYKNFMWRRSEDESLMTNTERTTFFIKNIAE